MKTEQEKLYEELKKILKDDKINHHNFNQEYTRITKQLEKEKGKYEITRTTNKTN
ncbi:hypothetical protein DelCs14_2851 [Delftia sp. Cs1-4]|uniref:hypothetical protein n=1 Tax=Delftia sp. (strain Cs1-4) TaxID=742013 RepID=UPI00020E84E0|nr:hypothetical protein [Delftia sp. Cs1-4]AEF89863.1 hypothetical protein DelCs14_2851 [Delftia sp. Cs1-4]